MLLCTKFTFIVTITILLPLLATSIETAAHTAIVAPGTNTAVKDIPQGADKDPRKYFKEPPGDELGHYDLRYFHGVVPEVEMDTALRRLMQAFLAVFRAHDLEVWLAHGTLLGWWWNGRIMPWDSDLDVQVSLATLTRLSEDLNGTTHTHTFVNTAPKMAEPPTVEEQSTTETKEYLIDINPHFIQRDKGDGMNFIDARFIDTSNGLFVDITGLSETNPYEEPGVWRCKNDHKYETREIYPLRETLFEGNLALVPYDFDHILEKEYSSLALTRTEWQGHIWNEQAKQWVVKPQPPQNKKRNKGAWKGQSIADIQDATNHV